MRAIKFRGKRADCLQWITGYYVQWSDSHAYKHFQIVSKVGYHNDIIPETVGQFTGLLDKNGKEIYEGDILANDVGIGVVEYGCGRFGVNWDYGTDRNRMLGSWGSEDNLRKLDDGYNRELNIIGNIHDNPELLKTK